MKEKIIAIIARMHPEKLPKVEDLLDNLGATIIFVKQTEANRKLVVKNLPAWEDEKQNDRSSTQ